MPYLKKNICDLTAKLKTKRTLLNETSQRKELKKKDEKNQVRKSPKSDIKLACFDIL